MGNQGRRKLIGYLPLAFLATFLVLVAPLGLVFWLRTSGVVNSAWVGGVIGVAVSFLASYAGATFWKRRKTDSQDLLFSELMLWGWVQRWRSERRLTAAADLLGLTGDRPEALPAGGLTNAQKASLLTRLGAGLEARDPYTHGHSRRVARHASNIAKRMGLPHEQVARIRAAGAMHDVGKVKTPIEVLHKEGKLTDEEFAIVKAHPVDGAVMVAAVGDDDLTAMVRHHHERLDGTGYPDGLAGQAIPVGARILAVADTFDAITSTRPYRHAHAHKKALDILVAEAGTQLDPVAVRAFCRSYSGRRPLAYWTILANARPRLASWMGSGLSSAKAATANVVAAAAAATAAAGGGVALAPLVDSPAPLVGSPVSSHTAPAAAAAAAPATPQNGRPRGARSASPAASRPANAGSRPVTQARRRAQPRLPAVPASAPAVAAPEPPAPDLGGAVDGGGLQENPRRRQRGDRVEQPARGQFDRGRHASFHPGDRGRSRDHRQDEDEARGPDQDLGKLTPERPVPREDPPRG